mgnify:CR=1 FL=1
MSKKAWIGIIAVVIVGTALWLTNRSTKPEEANAPIKAGAIVAADMLVILVVWFSPMLRE